MDTADLDLHQGLVRLQEIGMRKCQHAHKVRKLTLKSFLDYTTSLLIYLSQCEHSGFQPTKNSVPQWEIEPGLSPRRSNPPPPPREKHILTI